ncbi:MAG: PH domain-containing protein [Halodesulfurarchaeum sp.]
MERLNPRVQVVWAVLALLVSLVVGAIAGGAVWYFLDRNPSIGAGIFLVLAVVGIAHGVMRYRIWRFDVQEDALLLQRGVLTRVRTVVPFVRVQHVDTQRNPIERVAGLSRVVVYTAGTRGADVTIPGLRPDRASELQKRLRTLAGERETDDAV